MTAGDIVKPKYYIAQALTDCSVNEFDLNECKIQLSAKSTPITAASKNTDNNTLLLN